MHEIYFKYQLDERQQKAYQICLMWQNLFSKMFPNEKCIKLKSNCDPRKCILFQYCYKLVNETYNILKNDEYLLYVKAQLTLLKLLKDYKNSNVYIHPNCLVGDKAWVRWKIWKKKYDQLCQHTT